ncbi:MAG: cytochrome c oxidase subunit 3 [Candidatus Binatia bacterium]|nr:cytochrome c oxidase subunit 3 [Candidatus Binatia bacterium]
MEAGTETLRNTGIDTGKIGMWWFLASEITVFGGLIASYIVTRLGGSGWSEAASHLNLPLALLNTFVLLTSSLTMVLAFAGVEDKKPRMVRNSLALTILLGFVFLIVMGFEYASEIGHGFTPASGIFWSFYFVMTGLHALHVLGGIVANTVLFIAVLRDVLKPNEHRIELVGLYWHFVDIVWIFLLPLLYLN